ncbi:hypothetical protein CHISP_0234 [Chitinispirillum alkaliphilum]|nr:hypothetical protein CHISP_0234 [Chitinispirillum alkaliphilum]
MKMTQSILLASFFITAISFNTYSYHRIGINYNYGTKGQIGIGAQYSFSDTLSVGAHISANRYVFNRTANQPDILYEGDKLTGSFSSIETLVFSLSYTPAELFGAYFGGDIGIGMAWKNHFDTYIEQKTDNYPPLYYNRGRYKTASLKETFPIVNISKTMNSRSFYVSTGYSFFLNEITFRIGYFLPIF